MASKKLMEIMKQADSLSPDEQLDLISHLAQHARESYVEAKPRRKWSEISGIAPYPLTGEEDAQDWVTRSRREDDEHREQQLRGTRT